MVFIATQKSGGSAGQNPNPNLTNGFITVDDIPTSSLKNTSATASLNYGLGSFGFFNSSNWKSQSAEGLEECCPLHLVGAAIYGNDSIGPFAGGYKESQKSKLILPKTISAFYRVDACTAQAQVTHIGNTKYTKSLSPLRSNCSFEFRCGETYTLHVEARGDAALWFLNRQAYRNIDFYTGCCPTDNPTEIVDSTLVMIGWANYIINDPILQVFYTPNVYDENGVVWYKPGTVGQQTWDNYVSPGHQDGKTAGLRLAGSYTDTQFSNCTFEVSDNFNLMPVMTTISMVDLTGDSCAFTGICALNECDGLQAMGTGEQIVRDLALSEAYRQHFLASNDMRIREITQGTDIVNAASRTRNYTRYVLIHNIRRTYNPSSLYDQDQYAYHIITDGPNTALETFMNEWLGSCADCVSLETFGCTPCTILTP